MNIVQWISSFGSNSVEVSFAFKTNEILSKRWPMGHLHWRPMSSSKGMFITLPCGFWLCHIDQVIFWPLIEFKPVRKSVRIMIRHTKTNTNIQLRMPNHNSILDYFTNWFEITWMLAKSNLDITLVSLVPSKSSSSKNHIPTKVTIYQIQDGIFVSRLKLWPK